MKIEKQKVRLCMARKCITLKELVEKTEMQYSTVKGALSGRSARPSTIGKIAKGLGVDVTEILADE